MQPDPHGVERSKKVDTTDRASPVSAGSQAQLGHERIVDARLSVPLVSDVGFSAATPSQVQQGLVGYVTLIVLDALRTECTLRRTTDGRLTISFPIRRDSMGRAHSKIAPASAAAHAAIEAAVLRALEDQGHLPRTSP